MSDFKANIKKLYLFKFLKSFYLFSGILVPFFIDWGNINFFQITLLQAWFVLWMAILEVPTGAVADFFGRKTSITIGIFVNIIAVFTYIISPNFYFFLLAEFLWALSAALISGADVALVYDSLKEVKKEKESKKILGRYNSFELYAILIAAPLGSFIASKFGSRYAVMAMAIPFFMALLISFTIKEPHFKKEKESTRYLKVMISGIKYFYKSKILRILAFDSISVSIMSFFIVWFYQPLLLNLGLALAFLGIIHSLGSGLEIVISNRFSKLEDLSGSKKNYVFF